jgi:hypothetical protein
VLLASIDERNEKDTMSLPPTRETSRTETDPRPDADSLYRAISRNLQHSVETLGFWAAVTTPFLHLPLLFSGLETGVEVTAFCSLVVVNAVALLVGHKHSA